MAGDSVRIYPSAQLMIHSAWTIAMGNSSEFRDVAEVLEKIDLQLA
jgi:ATP-dependent Clp protease protease subunit